MRHAMFLGLFILWLISIIRYVRRQMYRALHVVTHLYYQVPHAPCHVSRTLHVVAHLYYQVC
jgi:hypothetical protein